MRLPRTPQPAPRAVSPRLLTSASRSQLKKNGNVAARNKAGKTPAQLATTAEMRQLFAEAGRARDATEAKPEASTVPSAEVAEAAASDHSAAAEPAPPPPGAEVQEVQGVQGVQGVQPQAAASTPQPAPPTSSLPPPQLGGMAPPQLGKMAPPQLGKMAPPQLGGAASLSGGKLPKKRPRPTGPVPSCANQDEEE